MLNEYFICKNVIKNICFPRWPSYKYYFNLATLTCILKIKLSETYPEYNNI